MKNYIQNLKIQYILILFLLFISCSNENTEIEENIVSECEIDFLPVNNHAIKICGPNSVDLNNFYTIIFLASDTKTAIKWEVISGSYTIEEIETIITNGYTKSSAKIYINDDFDTGKIKAISSPDNINVGQAFAILGLKLNSINQP